VRYLVFNQSHYVLGAADNVILSKEKSLEHFKRKKGGEKRGTSYAPLCPLSVAVRSCLRTSSSTPDLVTEMSAIHDTLSMFELQGQETGDQQEPLNLKVTVNVGEKDILGVLLPKEKRVIEEDKEEGPVPKILSCRGRGIG
jgi:hypothetical protein